MDRQNKVMLLVGGLSLLFNYKTTTLTDGYAKDGGPGAVQFLSSFYHDSLRA